METKSNYNFNYFHILNKSIVRKKEFHTILSIIDTIIILIKILNIYQTNYNIYINEIFKDLTPALFFRDYSIFLRILPTIIYLSIVYIILILSIFYGNNKNMNKFEIIIINLFEILFIRIFFIFFCEFLFFLPTIYFIILFVLTLPFLIFIFFDLKYFHLGQFMLSCISFPFDMFTSICDREKIIIKIVISICSISTDIYICKFMYLLQFILLICFCAYNTYIILYRSYYLMNNELIDIIRYSNLLCLFNIQILVFFMKPEEIFKTSFITIFTCIFIFTTILVFMSYDPYNHITIDVSENPENLYYYYFLMDRNKDIFFYLDDKIKKHIYKCNCCSLCYKYQIYNDNYNLIEIVKDNENIFDKNKEEEKKINLFNMLYNGKDKSIILFNQLILDIKRLGYNCFNNNSYYIIKFHYIYYYSLKLGDITFALNMILLFNLINESNHLLSSNDKISINQIIYINKFLILYKEILNQIKEIISKNKLKRHIDKFFALSKKLTILNSSKFKNNLFKAKTEGSANYSFLLNICSLLYEEIFNKIISSHSIPIRENPQLIEETIKNFAKQNNFIVLNFNLKTFECKILNSGNELFDNINKNFYDLFPNQIKTELIQNFSRAVLYPKEKKHLEQKNKTLNQKRKQYIEASLIIKNNIETITYLWALYLKLSLLVNNHIKENIILNGYYIIHKNIIMTAKRKEEKEKICGFGTKDIMKAVYQRKLNYIKFLETDFMKNKISKESFSFDLNNDKFLVYDIIENKIKKKKNIIKDGLNKQFTNYQNIKFRRKSINLNIENNNDLSDNENEEEEKSKNENINNSQKVMNFIEDNASQSSAMTKSSLSSIWNINKSQSRENQNNYTSKKFYKWQTILGALLLILLILIIIFMLKIKIKKDQISLDINNYLDLIQFIRIFQQFSIQFLTITCVSKSQNGDCKSYISLLDTEIFNQTLFIMEQNNILAELGSESINKLIINSELIHDQILQSLIKGDFIYYIISKKKMNDFYNISYNLMNISLNEALLLMSNNMKIIVSPESRFKNRDKEPIFLLSGFENPFLNIQNLNEDLSDYQIAVYTYLINFRGFVLRFSALNQRFHTLITIRNKELLNFVNLIHTIIFVVMLFQIITILFYLYTYNSVLSEIINSIISKFDIIFDNENDFKKLYTHKINLLESIVNDKNNRLGISINDINKNCLKYDNLVNLNKKNENKLNRFEKDEENEIEFKDNQKFINWIYIYKKGYNRFYIIFTIFIIIMDVVVFGIIFGIWKNYEDDSFQSLSLIDDSWGFERQTLRIINFYHQMIFMNQTLDEISSDYFAENEYSTVENLLLVLYSYNKLRNKKLQTSLFKSFSDYCEYNCKALYDFIENIDNNEWITTLKSIAEKLGKNTEILKVNFIDQCNNAKTFIIDSVTPPIHGFYQKCIDSMILINNRSYTELFNKLFNGDLSNISSLFLNVTRYIFYIIGKVSYSGSFDLVIEMLGNTIIISFILYIITEFLLFIFYFFVYFWNINIECKNMFILTKVFEVTNSNDT